MEAVFGLLQTDFINSIQFSHTPSLNEDQPENTGSELDCVFNSRTGAPPPKPRLLEKETHRCPPCQIGVSYINSRWASFKQDAEDFSTILSNYGQPNVPMTTPASVSARNRTRSRTRSRTRNRTTDRSQPNHILTSTQTTACQACTLVGGIADTPTCITMEGCATLNHTLGRRSRWDIGQEGLISTSTSTSQAYGTQYAWLGSYSSGFPVLLTSVLLPEVGVRCCRGPTPSCTLQDEEPEQGVVTQAT